MKKLLSLLFLISLFPHATPAQSLLWKVEGKDLSAPSYLFGTIHALCASEADLPDIVVEGVNSTAQIALELDLDDPALQVEMGHISFMPGDSTLNDVFSPEDYARLSLYLKDSVGMSLDQMNKLRPFFLVGLLITKVLRCKVTSFEEMFMAFARTQDKEIVGIETPAEQLDAFSSISMKEQADMVMEMVDHMDSTRTEFRKLAKLYKEQDLEGLREFVEHSNVEYGRYSAAMLVDRNERWVPRIERIMQAKPTFFAVGAGHLPGEHGVLSLLRKAGYKVSPVR
ncbi:TraB/GumN family protein [bacterium]|nr:TraB/GumN family protein [bacterium]